MKHVPVALLLVSGAAIGIAAFSATSRGNAATPHKKPSSAMSPIASAMSAAPKSIASGASIMAMGADGTMKELRKGTNGWTCMPDSPATPGPDPMCMDANASAWAMAWMGHKDPPTDKPGLMYMLEGGTDASNTDPYATKPDGNWIKTGPHIMIVGSTAALAGYPSGPKPDTSAPYVMWAGTPYAHLMVPVK